MDGILLSLLFFIFFYLFYLFLSFSIFSIFLYLFLSLSISTSNPLVFFILILSRCSVHILLKRGDITFQEIQMLLKMMVDKSVEIDDYLYEQYLEVFR